MAVFAVRVMHGAEFRPPEAWEQIFDDVPLSQDGQANWAAKWVNEASYDAIVQNCGADMQNKRYFPDRPVTRGEAACMLYFALTNAKAAAPGISPNGGEFTGPAPVSLTSAASGATIRYTQDGTTPGLKSEVYAGSLTLSNSAELTARAFQDGMAGSDVSRALFTISAIPQPDLAVLDLVATPESPMVGQEVALRVTVKNEGGAGTEATSISVTLSTAGAYALSGEVDIYNVVAESNEQNNQRVGASYTVVEAPRADLIVSELKLTPLNAVEWGSISFSGKVKNQGNANAGGFWVVFCVDSESMDQCYGNQDGQVGEAQRISSLAAGATSAPLSSAGSWSGSAGVHTAYLCADILGEVSEGSNESHTSNCVSKAFTVYSVPAGQPDLAVIDLAWSPADPSPGASASFTITIANYGTTATEAMRIGCHLGSPSGTLIGETWLIAFMPGETRAIACGSRNFSAGTYEIFGVVETEAPEAVTGDDVGSEKLRVD